MAYDRAAIVLRINGCFGSNTSPLDFWSAGLRLTNGPGEVVPVAGLTAFLTAVAPAIQTFHATSDTKTGLYTYVTHLTAGRVGLDGKYDPKGQLTSRYDYPSAIGGTGAHTQPWSGAMVYSLRTAIPRGHASNGRFYYPACSITVDGPTGRVATAQTAVMASRAKTLFDAINTQANILTPGLRIAVMSAVGTGMTAYVTSVRIDGRVDSQERRENKQPAVYSSANLA